MANGNSPCKREYYGRGKSIDCTEIRARFIWKCLLIIIESVRKKKGIHHDFLCFLIWLGADCTRSRPMAWCLFRIRVSISIRPHVYRAYSIIFLKTQNTFEMYIFLRFILTVTEVPGSAVAWRLLCSIRYRVIHFSNTSHRFLLLVLYANKKMLFW